MRVLIIDDDRDSADGLASLLTAAGHDVHVVVGAREGLDAVETWSPDVALLDIGLPDNGAYLVARRLRASVSSRPVRLVALTEWGQKEDRRRSATAGFEIFHPRRNLCPVVWILNGQHKLGEKMNQLVAQGKGDKNIQPEDEKKDDIIHDAGGGNTPPPHHNPPDHIGGDDHTMRGFQKPADSVEGFSEHLVSILKQNR